MLWCSHRRWTIGRHQSKTGTKRKRNRRENGEKKKPTIRWKSVLEVCDTGAGGETGYGAGVGYAGDGASARVTTYPKRLRYENTCTPEIEDIFRFNKRRVHIPGTVRA